MFKFRVPQAWSQQLCPSLPSAPGVTTMPIALQFVSSRILVIAVRQQMVSLLLLELVSSLIEPHSKGVQTYLKTITEPR